MVDVAYVKSIEEENEKLRQQLEVIQEQLDVANAKIKIKETSDAGVYVPHEKEIVNGYQLYEVKEAHVPNIVFLSCVKISKSWLGGEKKEWFLFRVNAENSSRKNIVDFSFYSYPSGQYLDKNSYDVAEKMMAITAGQLYTIARQNKFVFLGINAQNNVVSHLPYYTENGKKRFLKEGKICYEPA